MNSPLTEMNVSVVHYSDLPTLRVEILNRGEASPIGVPITLPVANEKSDELLLRDHGARTAAANRLITRTPL